MRKPFRKNIEAVPLEEAHGGSGSRRLLLSKNDPVSQHFQAMTKGYLEPKGVFDWHKHDGVDEYFVVLRGEGTIEFRDESKMSLAISDLIYVPAGVEHRIENTGNETIEFYFVRLDA